MRATTFLAAIATTAFLCAAPTNYSGQIQVLSDVVHPQDTSHCWGRFATLEVTNGLIVAVKYADHFVDLHDMTNIVQCAGGREEEARIGAIVAEKNRKNRAGQGGLFSRKPRLRGQTNTTSRAERPKAEAR